VPFVLCPFSEQIEIVEKGLWKLNEKKISLAISLSFKCPNPFIMTVAVLL